MYKRLIFLTLILSSFFASGQTHYLAKSLRFTLTPAASDSSYLNGKMFWNPTSGKIRFVQGDSVSTVFPTKAISSSDPISGLTTPRIPYAASPSTLADDAALTWDAALNKMNLNGMSFFAGTAAGATTRSVFLGSGAGVASPGIGNTMIGTNAGSSLTSGGVTNTAIGDNAGDAITSGDDNTLVGQSAGSSISTAAGNTYIGQGAGLNYTGSYNTFLGFNAGPATGTGTGNILIGRSTELMNSASSNQLVIQNAIFGVNNSGTGSTVSTGDIGLYQKAPTHNLHITAPSANDDILLIEENGGAALFKINESAGVSRITIGAEVYDGTDTGSAGEVLTSNGAGAVPTWQAPTGGSGITVGTTTITSGTNTRILYNNSGVVGEYTLTGSGTVVAMGTSPTFTTDITTPLIYGSSASGGDLTLQSTSHATKGNINLGTASTYDQVNDRLGIGTLTPTAKLDVSGDDAANNTVTESATLVHTTSGTPAAGIGTGLGFTVETSASNNESVAKIEAVTTDVTSTSEDADLVFKTMAGGATAAERVRITSTGAIAVNGSSNYGTSGQVLTSTGNGPPTWQSKTKIALPVYTTSSASVFIDAQTRFIGMGSTQDGELTVTESEVQRIYFDGSYTITGADIQLNCETTGSAEDISVYVRLNNTTDTLIETLGSSSNPRRFNNTGLSISVTDTDYIFIKLVYPTWVTNPATCMFNGVIYIVQ
jgi:hypothetical protein